MLLNNKELEQRYVIGKTVYKRQRKLFLYHCPQSTFSKVRHGFHGITKNVITIKAEIKSSNGSGTRNCSIGPI